MKTLLVGFKKYASHETNPSEKLLARFLGKKDIQTILLDASYDKSKKNLEKAIVKDKPEAIIILNLTPFHDTPAMEQYAYNEMDSIQPDESGVIKTKEEIYPDSAKSLSTPFDLSRFNQILSSKELEAFVSVDGGRFFDNEAYFVALHSETPSLLIHLPFEEKYEIKEGEELVSALIDIISKNA